VKVDGVPRSSHRTGLAFLASLVSATALAASSGYWALSKAPDGVKAGAVFPDFSTNEFAGIALRCAPGANAVVVSVDSKSSLQPGSKARVALIADGAQSEFDGQAEHSEMDDQTRIVVNLALTEPILSALSKAGRIAYAINGVTEQLPTKNSRGVLTDFFSACGARPSADQGAVELDDQSPPVVAETQTVDEPELGFALRVPTGWDFTRGEVNGVKTWQLRNGQWKDSKVPADTLSVIVTTIPRTPGANPEKDFREFTKDYAQKVLHGGRVTTFAPVNMGGLDGFLARATGTIVPNPGAPFAVVAAIILVTPPGRYVVASAIVPSAAAGALDGFGAAGGLFGPRGIAVEPTQAPTPQADAAAERVRAAREAVGLFLKTKSSADWRAAVDAGQQATAAAPDSAEGWRELGVAYAKAPKDAAVDPKLAQSALARAVALAPNDAAARMLLAGVLVAKQSYAPAIEQIQSALELNPHLATSAVLTDLAGLYAKGGDAEVGLAFLAAFSKRHPEAGSSQVAQAILLKSADRSAEALLLARKIATDPASAPADADYARALLLAWL
jgi:hypothetical protein